MSFLTRLFDPSAPRRSITGRNEPGNTSYRPPESPKEWQAEHDRRRAIAYGEPYTVGEITRWQIFRALDDGASDYSPQSVALREDDSMRFVQRVNASALFRGEVSLQLLSAKPNAAEQAQAEAALEVWKASQGDAQSKVWANLLAPQGELAMECVRFGDGDYRVVSYEPSMVTPEFDPATGTVLQAIEVLAPFIEEDTNSFGEREAAVGRTYKRRVDAERIDVWVDGKHDEERSGPHGFGEIPCAWLIWQPMPGDPTRGVPCSHGMDAQVARIDSISAQVDAAGKRFANPILSVKGAKLDDPDVFKLGRILSGIPKDGSVDYVEPNMQGINALRAEREAKISDLRATRPEFIFHGAGAAASGEALKVRAAQFVGQVEEVRGTVLPAIARLLEMAVAGMTGATYTGEPWLELAVPPVLPTDTGALLDSLQKANDMGIIKQRDMVAAVQRVGLIPNEQDPDAYAAELQDLASDRATAFFGVGEE